MGSDNSDLPRLEGTISPFSGVAIEMPGHMGEERRIGGWPNLVEVANLAIRHMNELCDPRIGYLSYVGSGLGQSIPSFSRCLWDWIEASSYGLCGRIPARRLTGNRTGEEVELGQRKLTLASFHNLDGFAHRIYAQGWCEDTSVVLWEQARVLFSLMSWFRESEDERLLGYAKGILQALLKVSRKDHEHRRFIPEFEDQQCFGDVAGLVLIEPLIKYYDVTGDSDALLFCDGIARFAASAESHIVDEKYRVSGSLRALAAGLAGLATFASYTRDERLLTHTERIFRTAREVCTAFGATPDGEPCCTNMELATVAIALTRAGHGEWWDMIDRHFRNHTLACQFTDPEMVHIGYLPGIPKPFDDTRDIVRRSRGGFSWASAREHNFAPAAIMLCCTGNAMWTMGKIVSEAVTRDGQCTSINLHYSLDTPFASITNYEPFEGRLEVIPRRTGQVRIRIPTYAKSVVSTLNGAPLLAKRSGSYLVFDEVLADTRITLTFPLPEKQTVESTWDTPGKRCNAPMKSDPVPKERINVRWRGNTVLSIDYDADSPQPKHRLYLDRENLLESDLPHDTETTFFLPEKEYRW